ncbi:MAG: zinc-ribbon domain-containing protein [Glycocaulis sp.]
MIVTCPSCETRYRVDPEAMAVRAGRVRCAACGHGWKVSEEELTLSEPAKPTLRKEPVDMAPKPLSAMEPVKPHEVVRKRAETRRHRARQTVEGAGWAVVAACSLMVLGAAFLFRVDIVDTFPRAASAYAAIGLEVNPHGLEIRDLRAFASEDEAGGLVIEGVVVNVTGRERACLPLRAMILDTQGQVLVEWVVMLDALSLPARGEEAFRSVLADPPEGAAELEVIFSTEG